MPTPAERQALLFFAAIAALGVGVNAWRAVRSGDAAVQGSPTELASQIARVDSLTAASPSREAGRAALKKRNAEKKARKQAEQGAGTRVRPAPPAASWPSVVPPPSSVGPLDLDIAPAVAIESLPRIGPALAARIVASRDSFGPFGSLEGLQRVRGIGPAMAKALRDRVAFSGVPRAGLPAGKGKAKRAKSAP